MLEAIEKFCEQFQAMSVASFLFRVSLPLDQPLSNYKVAIDFI